MEVERLIKVLLDKTKNESLIWNRNIEQIGFEYSYMTSVQLRDSSMKFELCYSDKKGSINNSVLKAYNRNTKLLHITGGENKLIRDLAFALYIRQQKDLRREVDLAVRSLRNLKANENNETPFKIGNNGKFKTWLHHTFNMCLHNWIPYNGYNVCGICGKIK